MSNLIKRTVPVLLVLIVCITCLVSPVSATSSNDSDSSFFNFFNYNDSNSYYYNYLGTAHNVTFEKPHSVLRYMELVVYTDYADFKAYFRQDLQIYQIAPQLYRCIWVGMHGNSSVTITFSGSNNANFLNVLSAKYANVLTQGYQIGGSFNGYAFGSSFSGSYDGSAISNISITQDVQDTPFQYQLYLYPDNSNWQRWDKLSLRLNLYVYSIESITASVNGVNILEYVSFIDNSDSTSIWAPDLSDSAVLNEYRNSLFYVELILDLSEINKGAGSYPMITITGDFIPNQSSLGAIYESNGFLVNEPEDPLIFWFRKISNSLESLLVDNSSSLDSAVQTQEEINVSVNNQLVGAVEDWNTNIEVVQTGYDSAVTKTTPALGWLASLADRIFTNMGWFGNIYFLVGLISVIMLVLSKSGLARSVSRFRRNE